MSDPSYEALKRRIDQLIASSPVAADFEAKKGALLIDTPEYLAFLGHAAGIAPNAVAETIRELSDDREFFAGLQAGLQVLSDAGSRGLQTGELRVHAHTLYFLVRILKPRLMVETGVASGKSSALILRAMQRNGFGQLHSVDLPAIELGGADPNAEAVIPDNRAPGWLVPQSLKEHWTLHLGDARDILPSLRDRLGPIDVFLHDSLHTYEHMTFELGLAAQWVGPTGVIFCDDILCNSAFEEASRDRQPAVFGTFGVFRPTPWR